MDPVESKRPTLVSYGRIFGVEISPSDASLEGDVDDLIGFLAEIDTLDLELVSPAATFDPAWPRVNENRS